MGDLMNLTVDQIWEKVAKVMSENQTPYEDLNAVYQFEILGEDGGTYQLVFLNGTIQVISDNFKEPKCTLQMKVSDFKKFLKGKMNSTAAFMMGKLKIQGSIGLALKLEGMLGQYEL